jgi:hypothetical protein
MEIIVQDLKEWKWGKPEEWGILAVTLFACLGFLGFLFGVVRRWLIGRDL